MRRHLLPLALIPVVLLLAACGSSGSSSGSTSSAGASAGPAALRVATKANLGPVLVDAQGRTLYRFASDHGGKSTCTGACAAAWPPATVTGSSPPTVAGAKGTLTTTTRANGAKQLAFDGMPLYRFSQDRTPADAKGQGLEHFFVVPAHGATAQGGAGAATTSTMSPSRPGY